MTFALILALSFFSSTAPAQTWHCSNDLEIRCDGKNCKAEKDGEFTPMSVDFSSDGDLSVCAYTGCWEGKGTIAAMGNFLYIAGTDLPFSTASDSKQSISIAFDKTDNVAQLKAGEFSHPLLCTEKPSAADVKPVSP